jgi:hypothetical protein
MQAQCRAAAAHVRLGGDGGRLRAGGGLLLNLRDLLPLLAGRRDLRAQDDVADLALRERAHVHVVLLAVVRQDQVLQRNLHLQHAAEAAKTGN